MALISMDEWIDRFESDGPDRKSDRVAASRRMPCRTPLSLLERDRRAMPKRGQLPTMRRVRFRKS
jgi:hypothetical protein